MNKLRVIDWLYVATSVLLLAMWLGLMYWFGNMFGPN